MKKVFTTSILAAAVALSFGASAATISSTPLEMSQEGVAQDVVASNQLITFDIVVAKEHPSASTITLTFDDKVDLDTIAGGAVTQSPANGKATAADIAFDYGTGSFTFDNVVVSKADRTIKFDVNLGNPLTANSAFRISIGNHDYATDTGDANLSDGVSSADLSGASTVAYSSATAADVAIETGTGVISKEISQFGFVVKESYDKLINRLDTKEFNDATLTDDLKYEFSNDQTLAAALTNVGAVVDFSGNFKDLLAADFVVATHTEAVTDTKVSVSMAHGDVTDDGVTAVTVPFARVTNVAIPETGAIEAKVTISSANGTADFTYTDKVSAGLWRLDASIVNVPYLPVGYGLTPNVEIANEMATDSDIQVRAFDQFSTEYPLTLLPFPAKAHTVTKVSEKDLQTAFGIAADTGRKLSVTFVIDADAEKVTLAPYYKQNESRVNVMSDQYKGKTATCTTTNSYITDTTTNTTTTTTTTCK